MPQSTSTPQPQPSPTPAVAAAIVAAGTALVLAPIDPQPIRDLNTPPAAPAVEPEPEPAVVANYDCYGGLWGYDTVTKAEDHFAETLAEGGTVEEWQVADRAGQPLRIVRTTDVDTRFLGGIDISVIPGPAAGPSCCGRPMTREGSQWVCRTCHGSWDDGAATASEHERAKEPLPTRPPRPHPQGRTAAVTV